MHLAFRQATDVHMDDVELALTVAAAEAHEMSGDDDTGHDVEMADEQEFIQKMVESKFSRKLALRALKEVGSQNTEEGNIFEMFSCTWCTVASL